MKATIRSIAREANVSPATVSRVLGGSTQVTPHMRSHVLNIARKLGYHSAGIRNVALIAGESFYSGYDALLLQALREELRHRNYRAVLVTTSDLGALDDCVIAGAISIAYQDGREKLWIRNRALPMICINTTAITSMESTRSTPMNSRESNSRSNIFTNSATAISAWSPTAATSPDRWGSPCGSKPFTAIW